MKKSFIYSILLLIMAGCEGMDYSTNPYMRVARLEYDIANSTPGMLSEGLVFYQEGKTLEECEQAYRKCRLEAKMATANIRDVISRSLKQYSLAREGMQVQGYQQIKNESLPAGIRTNQIDEIFMAGK